MEILREISLDLFSIHCPTPIHTCIMIYLKTVLFNTILLCEIPDDGIRLCWNVCKSIIFFNEPHYILSFTLNVENMKRFSKFLDAYIFSLNITCFSPPSVFVGSAWCSSWSQLIAESQWLNGYCPWISLLGEALIEPIYRFRYTGIIP